MITTTTHLELFSATRKKTEEFCMPLATEDYVVQPVEFVSPPKWHLGHTTWFFEEFVLKNNKPNYSLFDEQFAYVFNSYYESVGEKVIRTNRGNLSRPTVEKIYAYREYVTREMVDFLKNNTISDELNAVIEIGIHHEKQHQELLLTDIKYILGNNPLLPAYHENFQEDLIEDIPQKWIHTEEGVYEIGAEKDGEFHYDNEFGQHKVYANEFFISNKLVTNQEYIDFMEAGGYENVLLWHAEAWDWINTEKIKAPQYWYKLNNEWHSYKLNGFEKINPNAALTHISYYEAFAFAQWKNLRLPTEFEWEIAQEKFNWGKRWEWTESAYLPYPNYKKAEGALGEYNGKFMVNQKVLRGGSIATANHHTKPTYRNFFHPNLRWQFNGIRLAK
ncbi:ergothioneine biosynthesis protein EgtB [Mesonia maritima]|uniref:Ergothioneine biosynthesis protein EgtB n=1 Tax=Mesonia maritima TaxID=1793873 RepID=A0ABU1KBN6_9FLAO|nr:ergothioneine biosynthesis protein EgtB [Mesonia maritima]MDR6301978.1 ergothioneine biosynthesis protein EgtB [Mesonia maritima]